MNNKSNGNYSYKKRVFISLLASIIFVVLGFMFNIYDLTTIKHIIRIPFDFVVYFVLSYISFPSIEIIKKIVKKDKVYNKK